jgi:dihydrolipoamide dehydrogenase
MSELKTKLLIIGGGPAGYVCGIRAGQLGLDTILVDAEALGGTCLNVGCIPSKAVIHAADEFSRAQHFAAENALGIKASAPTIDLSRTIAWKDGIVKRLTGGVAGLLKKSKVRVIEGRAKFLDGKSVTVATRDGAVHIDAENIVIATGSVPVELPFLKFGGDVISSTGALALSRAPKALAIVGAGYIGLELGIAFAKFGSKVTIVEAMDRILPTYDQELTRPVAKRLKALGVEVLLNAKAKGKSSAGLDVEVDGATREIAAEKILVTVGRRPLMEGWGAENLALEMNGRSIRIDDQCRTAMRGVYAIGDVTGEPMLAHRGMAQGEMVAEIIAGHKRRWDKRAIPAICFTDPEIVSCGLSPDEAKAAGHTVKTALFPFSANGRAMTMENEDGFVRVVARAEDHLLLGVQATGAGVAELSAAFALAIEMCARLEDVAGAIHAHPTQGEALQEAMLRTLGHALHI